MMTALLVVERAGPARARADHAPRARTRPARRSGVLPKRKQVQLEALLNGLLLVSGNDAAVALAQHTAGTRAGVRAS